MINHTQSNLDIRTGKWVSTRKTGLVWHTDQSKTKGVALSVTPAHARGNSSYDAQGMDYDLLICILTLAKTNVHLDIHRLHTHKPTSNIIQLSTASLT